MKIFNSIWRGIACGGLSLALVGGVALPLQARAANDQGAKGQCTGQCEKPGKVSERRQEFRAMGEQILAEARANDAALQKLIGELNSAPESKKVDLEAAILNQMVTQHHEMLAQWENMHQRAAQLRKERIQTSRKTGHYSQPTAKSGQDNAAPEK